jgi:nicotinamide mononucleotide adenylyltransferase
MRLRELFEKTQDEVAVIFGRFNPPHQGHRAAWELMSQANHWYVGTNASTQGPKDPLPFDVKIEAMKTIYPDLEGHLMSSQSWLTMVSELYKKHPNIRLIVYTDEDWVVKTIKDYNGIEGKAHGFYDFNEIEQKPTPRLSSATALRDAVKAGDREAFAKAAGVPTDTEINGKPYFDLVAEYLLPYAEQEKAKAAKKKKQPVENFNEANYGRYWCSTDKKWKYRKGPKQKRSS